MNWGMGDERGLGGCKAVLSEGCQYEQEPQQLVASAAARKRPSSLAVARGAPELNNSQDRSQWFFFFFCYFCCFLFFLSFQLTHSLNWYMLRAAGRVI